MDTAGQVRWGRVDAAAGMRDVAVWGVDEPVAAVALTTTPDWLVAGGGGFRVLSPDAGRLFTVRIPDVVGRPAFRYRGPLRSLTTAGGDGRRS